MHPEDYIYEVPHTYCDFEDHYCPIDEDGNWIYNPYLPSYREDEEDDNPKYDDENDEENEDYSGLVWDN